MKKKILKKRNLFILTILALISLVGVSYGRFIYNGIRNYYLSTKNFYFNSDKLSENLKRYQIDNWSGVESVPIDIYMNSRKNNKVSANENIDYTIEYSCSSNVVCSIDKTESTIYASTNLDSFTIIMTPIVEMKDGDSIWLEVKASAFEPYEKTLSGRFVINVGTIGISYEITDSVGSPYMDFNITNTTNYYHVVEPFDGYDVNKTFDIPTYLSLTPDKQAKCASAIITLTFDPRVLRLDMTNEAYLQAISTTQTSVDGFNYINSLTFKVDAISSARVRFYKMDTNNNYTYPYVNDNSIVEFSSSY